MIIPIGTLNINQIAERKDDLLVSVEDVKALARSERNKAIDEFAGKLKWEYENSTGVPKKEIDFAKAVIDMVAERMKGVQ